MCKTCELKIPCGKECQKCWARRRKWDKGPDSTVRPQAAVEKEMSESTSVTDRVQSQRRSLCQGANHYARVGDSSTAEVKISEAKSKFYQEQDEGYFYKLDSFLELMKAPDEILNSVSVKAKVKYCIDVLHEKVHKSPKTGVLGVYHSNLPQGAEFKYVKGEDDRATVETEDLVSDAEDAADAFEKIGVGEAPELHIDSVGDVAESTACGKSGDLGTCIFKTRVSCEFRHFCCFIFLFCFPPFLYPQAKKRTTTTTAITTKRTNFNPYSAYKQTIATITTPTSRHPEPETFF